MAPIATPELAIAFGKMPGSSRHHQGSIASGPTSTKIVAQMFANWLMMHALAFDSCAGELFT